MNTITLKSGEDIQLNQAFNCDCLDFMKMLPDKSVGLIMADPPYFEVKGDFDFIWESFEDYLKDVEKWAIECKRILADNGSLFWWGHAKKIAYSQIIFDKYFNLGNSLIWEKKECQTKAQDYSQARYFAPITERCLFYSNDWDVSSLDAIMFNPDNFKSIKNYLKGEKEQYVKDNNCTSKDFNSMTLEFGCSTTPYKNWFCNTTFWEMPSEPQYKLIQKSGYFKKPYESLRAEYESLRAEYEELRRPFNNGHKLNDIILHSQESNISQQYDHDTIKPLGLIKKLLQTTTRKDTLVYIPFWGSGTDSVACHELGLKWLATETSKKHYTNAYHRYEQETKQLLMEF